MKFSSILGLNARTQLFSYSFNTRKGKKIADSKLLTKKYLKEVAVPIPEIYAKFKDSREVLDFDWAGLPSSFALKPNKGLGGEGIIIVKKKAPPRQGFERQVPLGVLIEVEPVPRSPKGEVAWITTQKKKVTGDDLKLHALDILEGAFSIGSIPDKVYIEEYVGRHKAFRKYAFRGTPDIRVIVCNSVPVMAMLRLPTRESQGRANLHQGAIGVGIDIATGITTKAIWHGRQIRFKPGTNRKLHGIKIPLWTSILEIAVKAQKASFLGYVGVDVVLHPEKGPMVLEINAQPGLSIQLANMTGLKKRLEKVEDLKIRDAEHGVKVAKALFAGPFSDRVKAEEGIKTIHTFEEVRIKNKNGQKISIPAKIDTGAWRSSIDKTLAKDLGLLHEDNILWKKNTYSAMGQEKRPIINLTFWLSGRKIKTSAGVADRSHLRKPLIIGRRDLTRFLIDSGKKDE